MTLTDENDPDRPTSPRPAVMSPPLEPDPSEPAALTPGEEQAARRERNKALYVQAMQGVNDVLQRNCSSCHGKDLPNAPCGLRFDNTDDLYVLRLVAPLSFEDSPIVKVILDQSMPPPGVEPRPSADDLDALRAFIDDPLFWSTLPPDGGNYYQAERDAEKNACPDAGTNDRADTGTGAGPAPVDAGFASD